MSKENTSSLNNQTKGEVKKLEDYMSQVMRQNGMRFWELDMTGRRMEGMNSFGGKNLIEMSKKDIENVPEALFEGEMILEEDWEKCQEMFKELYSGKKENTRVQCRTWSNKAQDYVWYEYNFSIIEKKNGVPVRAIGTSRDISYQKRVEQLYEEEQKILLEADDSMISFSRINLTKNIVEKRIAKGKEVVFENTSDSLDFRKRAQCYFDDILLTDEDNYELSVEGLHELYKSGIQEIEKYYIARRKGEKRYICVKVNGRILENPRSGDVMVFFYNRDDTLSYINRLTMKAVLERDYEMAGVIYADTAQYRVITEMGNLPGNDLPVVDYDEELKNFYVCAEKEEADRLIKMVCFEKVYQELQEKSQYSVEFDMKEDGVTRRKLLRFNYISNTMHLILATRIDIDDVVQTEMEKQHQLEGALNEAEKANSAKTEFLTTVSHEIRTPMNVIIGMVQLAKEEKDNHDAVMEYIDEIGTSSRYLLNLLNNVLDMSKIESGEFSLHPQRYSFDDLKRNATALFMPMCDRKQIHFEVRDFADQKMMIDKMRLHQVVFNLLNNAVKYTDVGGEIQLIYRTKLYGENVKAEIIVKDNGIGMSKEFQKEMYKPFVQENNQVVASMQGTGLGLSIVKGIIDKMNGELTVKSELGKGTEFCIRITAPIVKEKDSFLEKEDFHDNVDFTGKTILVAEDHELNQRIIKKLLINKGAKVIIADNGKAAVDYFMAGEENSIHAILMDVRMPVMDGLLAAKMIRRLNREDARVVPIIAMTANAYDEDREKSNAAGMDGHLSKPIDTGLLYDILRAFFRINA